MVAWSTTAKAGMTLSGGNLIATNTQAGFPGGGGLADTGITAAQKICWQVIVGNAAVLSGIGIASSFSYGADYLGGGAQNAGYYGDGNVYTNNAGAALWAAFGNGDTVQFAYDRVNSRLWARVNGGNWNNSGTANPATNTGGLSVSGITGTNVFPGYYAENSGATTTLGATAAAQGTIPSGFTAYDPGGATAYTLTAAVGVFALAGLDALFPRNRVVGGAVGAFVLAGQAALLKRSRIMAGALGSFSLAGQAASFVRGYGLLGAVGSFALAGQPATFLRSRVFVAEASAFTLVGQDSGLLYARLFGADAGAFAFTGQDAVLTKTGAVAYSLQGAVGEFLFIGSDANLIAPVEPVIFPAIRAPSSRTFSASARHSTSSAGAISRRFTAPARR